MVGTLEGELARREAMAAAKRDRSAEYELLPMWLRLEVPFASMDKLKEWRELMAGFLATVDFYLQPRAPGAPYIEERARLIHLRSELHQINSRVREYKGRGRPERVDRKPRRYENL